MATLDLSRATARVHMLDANMVKFGTSELATSTSWSFNTGRSTDLQFDGSGMTFDSVGRALTGTVTRIGIDLGDNDFDNPDILITGISAKATTLDDGHTSFWQNILAGNDTIIGPSGGSGEHVLFGDASTAVDKAVGGNDRFELGSDQALALGDVFSVGSSAAKTISYTGGHDTFLVGDGESASRVVGDANYVYPSATLTGGNDSISLFVSSPIGVTVAIGDAAEVGNGTPAQLSTVIGGNDTIAVNGDAPTRLVGDVDRMLANSFVRGGNDVLTGGALSDTMFGDISVLGNNKMQGGNDLLIGNGGGDYMVGDVQSAGAGGLATSGHDTLRGGTGDDTMYGDGPTETGILGGHDKLYGDSGADYLMGGGGNDLLDGGTGFDSLLGGTGNDTYVVDMDIVVENAGGGTDTILTKTLNLVLPDHVEILTYTGTGNFTGYGTNYANIITGGSGADLLLGNGGTDRLVGGAHYDTLRGGNHDDVLVGGSGADVLDGGDGRDIASYEGAETGVTVSLDGSVIATGDAAGDSFVLIESLRGSNHGDRLTGDNNPNSLEGRNGNDVLSGKGGTDILVGGAGRDQLTGGLDSDRFVFTAVTDSGITATTRDFITDFTKGQDLIDLMALDANPALAGNNAFALLAKGTASSAVGTGKIGWYQVDAAGTADDRTFLRINTDADTAIEMTIELRGLVNFTAADFVL